MQGAAEHACSQCAALTQGLTLQLAKAGELSSALVAFLSARGGRAPSADVVSHFSDRVAQAEAPLFRHLLHQVGRP